MHRLTRLGITGLVLGSARLLAAQTFPTDDPVIKRIYAVGIDSSHLQTEAHVLFDSLGPRLMGTPNLKRADDWLVATYKSWGVDAKEEQYGTWRGWERGRGWPRGAGRGRRAAGWRRGVPFWPGDAGGPRTAAPGP